MKFLVALIAALAASAEASMAWDRVQANLSAMASGEPILKSQSEDGGYKRKPYDRLSAPNSQTAYCYDTSNLGTLDPFGGLVISQSGSKDPTIQTRWFNLTPGTSYTLVKTSGGAQIGPSFTAMTNGVGGFLKARDSDISLPSDVGSEICLNDGSSNVICCDIASGFANVALNEMNQAKGLQKSGLSLAASEEEQAAADKKAHRQRQIEKIRENNIGRGIGKK